ncbi:Putative glycosyltransferase EpsE [Arthrobacter saudimassiliensis]|uniref:Putative glycosyltransferase EpsE n=1 Tax=Arthrobacter saudimassiliensis TaxID=1461584 RepID=A0A078MQT8_9MICC|nr:Putative glycosyltransferase EpsE [Arthrobacter saudimassiliensis]
MQLIDVLMPYYGSEELLREAVLSVLAQTDPDWRLVIIDDAYPHAKPEGWLRALDDDRIEYNRNAENLGANANFRLALTLASSPYFVMMGADDRMLPGYLELVRNALDISPGAAAVQPGVEVIDETGRVSRPLADRVKDVARPKVSVPQLMWGEELATSLMHGGWHYFPSLAWRTEIVHQIGFRREYHVVQDLALLIDLVVAGHAILLDPTVVFQYRRHSASDSSVRATDGGRFDEEGRFFAAQAQRFHEGGWQRAERAARLHWTSRLHALSLVPAQLTRPGRRASALRLCRYALQTFAGTRRAKNGP